MGGVAAIAQAMAGVIEEQGGLLRLEPEVDEILVKDGRAARRAADRGEVLSAGLVVSNADAGHTYDRCCASARGGAGRTPQAEPGALVDGAIRLVLRHEGNGRTCGPTSATTRS